MSMQGLRILREDMERIRMAFLSKGIRWSRKSLPSVLSLLLITTLRRADTQAQLLALRGYRKGGSICPHFSTPVTDIMSVFSAVLILILALFLLTI
jgi:energy-coupling factor transport system permease protein